MRPDGIGAFRAVADAPIAPFALADDTVVFAEGRWHLTVNPSSTWRGANEIFFSDLDPERADAQIDAILALYAHLGLPASWYVYPWSRPADLGDRLRRRGSHSYGMEAVSAPAGPAPPLPPDVTIEPVYGDSANFEVFFEMLGRGWSLPADDQVVRRRCYRRLARPDGDVLELYLTRWQGQPAGVGGLIMHPTCGYGTLDFVERAHRGRGLYSALIAARAEASWRAGRTWQVGHTLTRSSTRILRHLGHEVLYSYEIHDFAPPAVRGDAPAGLQGLQDVPRWLAETLRPTPVQEHP